METEKPAAVAGRLCRALDRAVLSTAAHDRGGWPHGSLVLVACRFDGVPLMLLSRLAAHTRNLAADPRMSLLYDGTAGCDDPLAGTRASVHGRVEAEEDPRAMARFLRRHPGAARYAGFADFSLWRVAVERVHLVAGFGAVGWTEGALPGTPAAPALERAEADLVACANARHGAALADGLRTLGRGGEGWRATGIDPFGVDLRRGGAVARIPFDAPVETPAAVERALAALAA